MRFTALYAPRFRQFRLFGLWCLLLATAAGSGCAAGGAVSDGGAVGKPMELPSAPLASGEPMRRVADAQAAAPDRYTLVVQLNVFRVEVPFGLVSHSERLWRYLDEELHEVPVLARLHRNGFRVGRARTAEWDRVSELLRDMAGRSLIRTRRLAWPARPAPLTLREHQGHQRIFTFTDQGLLEGRDYEPGDNVLMLTCHLNANDPSEVLLQVAPVVRSRTRVRRWSRTEEGEYELGNKPVQTPVGDLQFTVKVPKGHYIVIGPGQAAARTTSPGHRFLTAEVRAARLETLLVIVPEVFAAPAGAPAAPAVQ